MCDLVVGCLLVTGYTRGGGVTGLGGGDIVLPETDTARHSSVAQVVRQKGHRVYSSSMNLEWMD